MKINVMTYNVNKSRDAIFRNESGAKLKKYFKASGADIIFLQEVLGSSQRRDILDCEFEPMADELWKDFAYGKNAVSQGSHHGNAILSKYPITEVENFDISNNRLEQRGLLFAKIAIPVDGSLVEVHLYCLHFDLLQRGRDMQLKVLEEKINKHSINQPCIIAGDFNDWNLKLAKRLGEKSQLIDCGKFLSGKYLNTFPALFPFLPLDHVFVKGVSPTKIVTRMESGMKNLSDHLPMSIELEIRVE